MFSQRLLKESTGVAMGTPPRTPPPPPPPPLRLSTATRRAVPRRTAHRPACPTLLDSRTGPRLRLLRTSPRALTPPRPPTAGQAAKLLAKVEAHAAAGTVFDLQDLFFRFTMDTFCKIAFGVELDSMQEKHPFSEAFDIAQKYCNGRVTSLVMLEGRVGNPL